MKISLCILDKINKLNTFESQTASRTNHKLPKIIKIIRPIHSLTLRG